MTGDTNPDCAAAMERCRPKVMRPWMKMVCATAEYAVGGCGQVAVSVSKSSSSPSRPQRMLALQVPMKADEFCSSRVRRPWMRLTEPINRPPPSPSSVNSCYVCL